MALNYRYDKKGKVTGIGWGKGPNAKAGTAKTKSDNEAARSTTKSKTTTKKKKPLSRAAKMKAERAQRKADFDAHQKALKKKGHGKMTLEERQADDRKRARAAAAKKHDEWQKKNKRGKYSTAKGRKTAAQVKSALKIGGRGGFAG